MSSRASSAKNYRRLDTRTIGITVTNVDRTIRAILNEGLIAVVPGDFPAGKLLEIGDALLAAPLLVMEITVNSSGALDAVELLRARFGDDMLIGAGRVDNADQFDQAVDAGAQYTASQVFDIATLEHSLQRDLLHMPGVMSSTEVDVACRADCKMVRLLTPTWHGHGSLTGLCERMGGLLFVPSRDIGLDDIDEYARAGAAAIALDTDLVTEPSQSMDDLITRARRCRAAWQTAPSQ